jgi:mannose-6-phosphate isomerase
MNWYPLKLTTHVRAYAFGDRLIPDMIGKRGLPDGIVAETWEISDYADTTGIVINGPLAGRTLHNLVESYPKEVVGSGWQGTHFPLLEKFLDASHMLPIHLHADDETARRLHAAPNGKSEAWHILWAAPDATILAGVRPGVTKEDLFRAFKAEDYDAVMPRFPIRTGDTVYVPGGVIHSFGPDTLIFEVQQTSDLAQSVMPTDVYGNRLDEATWDANIRATLAELRTTYQPRPNPGLARHNGNNRYTVGCAGPYFALERWTLGEVHVEPSHPARCITLSNVGESVTLEFEAGGEILERGTSCILPAAIGPVRVIPSSVADLIACYVPDLERDIWEPLRAAHHSDEAIRTLGEL